MRGPKKILVPTDLSDFSLEALDYAQEIAKLFSAEILVLFVIDKGAPDKPRSGYMVGEAEVDARLRLIRILTDRRSVPDRLKVEIRRGHPANEIVRAAQELHTDLIVMSTHGLTGLSHVLIGSVAEHVVRLSFLTVKPEKFNEVIELRKDDIKSNLHLN